MYIYVHIYITVLFLSPAVDSIVVCYRIHIDTALEVAKDYHPDDIDIDVRATEVHNESFLEEEKAFCLSVFKEIVGMKDRLFIANLNDKVCISL